LFIAGNGLKASALSELFNSISGLKLCDFVPTDFSMVSADGGYLESIVGLSVCFSQVSNESHLIQLLQQTAAHELWVVHSISQNVLDTILELFGNIPLCLGIHVGDGIEIHGSPTIAVIVEAEIRSS
jgi:hypothetical protein